MTLSSMTGFGTATVELPGASMSVEARSVNHRGTDVVCRMPAVYNSFEADIIRLVREVISRGRVDINVSRTSVKDQTIQLKFQESLFQASLDAAKKAMAIAGVSEKDVLPSLVVQLLARREVLELVPVEVDTEIEQGQLLDVVKKALQAMVGMRLQEGKALSEELLSLVKGLEQVIAKITKLSGKTTQLFRERLMNRLEKLKPEVDVEPQRIAQEVALAAERTDITEELARIASHISQFRDTIKGGGMVGRKLEFLLQELGREVNTTGSKVQNSELSSLVIEAKLYLEKMKEQVLNVE